MLKILVVNGANLNLLGKRDQSIYGTGTLQSVQDSLMKLSAELAVQLIFFQSNHEGELIDKIQQSDAEGLLINPGAFAHYSYALHDAIKDFPGITVEVHLSHIFAREPFRHKTVTAAAACGVVSGFGASSYLLGLRAIVEKLEEMRRDG